MAVSLNGGVGNIVIMKQPDASDLTIRGYSSSDGQQFISCNQPLIYQFKFGQTQQRITNLSTEADLISGDLVNALFEVFIGIDGNNSLSIGGGNMFQIGTIRKSRDIPYVGNEGIDPQYSSLNSTHNFHTFTVDIAPLVKNYLSYTLVPIKKGYMSKDYQMSGNYTTNNLWDFTSVQGSLRFVDVRIKFEVLETTGGSNLVIANDGSSDQIKSTNSFAVINSAPQHYDNPHILRTNHMITGTSDDEKYFFSNCPNGDKGLASTNYTPKLIRLDEEAEFLSYYLRKFNGTATSLITTDFYMRVTTKDASGATVDYINIRDWKGTLGVSGTHPFGGGGFGTAPLDTINAYKYIVQNVSPAYLDTFPTGGGGWNNGAKFTGATHYEAALFLNNGSTTYDCSETRYYKIDTEDECGAYDFVRFHWLNRLGGIDSYTAKRDVTESVSVNKTFFERKAPNQQYIQQYDGNIFTTNNDPLGNDLYKGQIDTLSITGTRGGSVFTEPLNTTQAKWLEELITSPNVWIELETEASKRANAVNPTSHPSTRDYMPVIIQNSNINTVSQSEGLVKFNIDYIFSNKLNTQSN
jgi:hypothetical protein